MSNMTDLLRVGAFVIGLVLIISGSTWATGWTWSPVFVAAAVALWFSLRGKATMDRHGGYLHFVAIIPLLVNGLGLCRSMCGGFAYYEQFLGFQLVWFSAFMHLGAGVLYLMAVPAAVRLTTSCLTIGGSIFFLYVLVSNQHFCGSCLGTHAVMAAMAAGLLQTLPPVWKSYVIGWSLAGAGMLSAWFHPRAFPYVQNDPQVLADFIQSTDDLGARWATAHFSSTRPGVIFLPRPHGGIEWMHPASLAVADSSERQASLIDETPPPRDIARPEPQPEQIPELQPEQIPEIPADSEPKPVSDGPGPQPALVEPAPIKAAPAAPAVSSVTPTNDLSGPESSGSRPSGSLQHDRSNTLVKARRMGVIGADSAPIVMVYYKNPECPVCSRQWLSLQTFLPDIAQGAVQLRLLIDASSPGGQLAQEMIYFATMMSDDAAFEALSVVGDRHSEWRDLAASQRVVDAFYRRHATDRAGLVSEFGPQTQRMVALTTQVRQAERVSGSPHLWLYRSGQSTPDRRFPGLTNERILRIALDRMATP